MRLVLLARKTNRSSREILDFLISNGIDYVENQNTKLHDEHAQLVLDHYGIEEVIHSEAESDDEPIEPTEESIVEETDDSTNIITKVTETEEDAPYHKERPIASEEEPSIISLEQEEAVDLPEEPTEEVIRAPKIKLAGPKVVGKIELPTKPATKEEEKENKQEILPELPPRNKHRSKKADPKKNGKHVRHKKTLSYEEKLAKEKKKAEYARKKAFKLEKEKKRQHYESIMAHNETQPISSRKKKKKDQEKVVQPKPKKHYNNVFTKLWAWLNDDI